MELTNQHTISEKLLIVALRMAECGETPFNFSLLTVRAWELYPAAFGLGTWGHPDSNKVNVALCGSNGMVGRGWFAKVGERVYELTFMGREEAMRLTGKPSGHASQRNSQAKRVHLRQDDSLWLNNIFNRANNAEKRFDAALMFWHLPDPEKSDIPAELAYFMKRLVDLAVAVGDGETILPGGRAVTGKEVEDLIELHGRLTKQYKRELTRCGQCERTKKGTNERWTR
jgi:hypothetical protein